MRPSLDVVRGIEDLVPDRATAAAALHALVMVDFRTLADTPHNIGTLYLLPEVQGERYDGFRTQRRELQDAYGRIGTAAASADVRATIGPEALGAVLLQLASS